MDDGSDYRGWDFWVQDNRIGMHLVHQWPNDALKVTARAKIERNQWHQVLITYDGSGDAKGIRIYYDGQPQAIEVHAAKVVSSTSTQTGLKLAQRSASSRAGIDSSKCSGCDSGGRGESPQPGGSGGAGDCEGDTE